MITKIDLTRTNLIALRVTEAFLDHLSMAVPDTYYSLGNSHMSIELHAGTDDSQIVETQISGSQGRMVMKITIMAEPTTAQCMFTALVDTTQKRSWRGLAEETHGGVAITNASETTPIFVSAG